MFNFFKIKKQKRTILEDWHIDDISDFKTILNTDSIQYVDEDASKIIYFSALNYDGNTSSLIDTNINTQTVAEVDNGWCLKGMKKSNKQILVCVITVNNAEHIGWAKSFFTAINPRKISN